MANHSFQGISFQSKEYFNRQTLKALFLKDRELSIKSFDKSVMPFIVQGYVLDRFGEDFYKNLVSIQTKMGLKSNSLLPLFCDSEEVFNDIKGIFEYSSETKIYSAVKNGFFSNTYSAFDGENLIQRKSSDAGSLILLNNKIEKKFFTNFYNHFYDKVDVLEEGEESNLEIICSVNLNVSKQDSKENNNFTKFFDTFFQSSSKLADFAKFCAYSVGGDFVRYNSYCNDSSISAEVFSENSAY